MWDVLLVEGMVVLFRVAVAIFILYEKELLAAQTPSAFYSLMHSMTSHLFSADKVVNVRSVPPCRTADADLVPFQLACEDLRTSVKQETVHARRDKHRKDLCAELGLDAESASVEMGGSSGTPTASSVRS